jgi:hypothetical protein
MAPTPSCYAATGWRRTESGRPATAPLVRQEIRRVLGQLKRDGMAILLVDKNIADVAQLADRHYILLALRTRPCKRATSAYRFATRPAPER